MGLLLACSTAKTQTRLLLIRKVILIAVYVLVVMYSCLCCSDVCCFVCENCDLILSQIWHTSFSIFVYSTYFTNISRITLQPWIHTAQSHFTSVILYISNSVFAYCANYNENLIDWKRLSTCTVGVGHNGEHLLFRIAPH